LVWAYPTETLARVIKIENAATLAERISHSPWVLREPSTRLMP
jgi:hypothetical protein